MIDFHTHILPNMDDGSDSVETSNKLLNLLEEQGVKLVCLTSHFYANHESINDYLKRREKAFNKLNYKGNLVLKLGAEVRYYSGISVSEDLNKLCLEGTNYLLLELPFFTTITPQMIEEITSLRFKGFIVVLAHIERYNISNKDLNSLHNSGVLFQYNVDYINGLLTGNKAISLIKRGYISFLGSDCHNLTNRHPYYLKAINKLKNKLKTDDLSTYIKKLYNINEWERLVIEKTILN